MTGNAARRWREDLDSWAIPAEILDAAPESPWGCPPGLFARAAEEALDKQSGAPTPSLRRALEVLPEGGSVLDVGAGGGAASLPLCPPAAAVTAVDQSPQMLERFAELAERQGIDHREVEGLWPDVAAEVGAADVVVCNHVLYNVGDLVPFVTALTDHARRRVVVEITAVHPQALAQPAVGALPRPGPPDPADGRRRRRRAARARPRRRRRGVRGADAVARPPPRRSSSPSCGGGSASRPSATPRWPPCCRRRWPRPHVALWWDGAG